MGNRPYLLIGAPDWVTLQAFAAGLDLIGRNCVWGSHGAIDLNAIDPAAIVIDGMRAGGRQAVAQAAERGIPAVVIDNGFMKRVNVPADHETGTFYVGFGGLGWAPGRAPDRTRFDKLGVTIRTRKPLSGPAVIMGQVPGDASHGLGGPVLQATYQRLTDELRSHGLPVVFRPHPLGFIAPPVGAQCIPPGAQSRDACIAGAAFVVSLNSNAGLDALIAGVPAVTLLPSHYRRLAYEWPVNPREIAPPDPNAVADHCARLAWAQWTLAEMRSGTPQRWLLEEGLIP